LSEKSILRERLVVSACPVERDIAELLHSASRLDELSIFRMRRYQRKIDVARRIMTTYDDQIDKAITTQTISSDGYLGLALVFSEAARREPGNDEISRANLLGWVNSAFNCMDRMGRVEHNVILADLEVELHVLLRKGSSV
jgi:hypothetical protein